MKTPALAAAGAAASGALVAVGAGLIYLPAGLIVAGLEGFGGCYVAAYLWARRQR